MFLRWALGPWLAAREIDLPVQEPRARRRTDPGQKRETKFRHDRRLQSFCHSDLVTHFGPFGFEAGHCECQLGARTKPAVSAHGTLAIDEGTDTVRKRVEEIVRLLVDLRCEGTGCGFVGFNVSERFTADLDDSEQIDLDQPLMQAGRPDGGTKTKRPRPTASDLGSAQVGVHEPHCRGPAEHAQRGGGRGLYSPLLMSPLCHFTCQMPGVDLPFTLIFDYPSVASIAAARLRWDPRAGLLRACSVSCDLRITLWPGPQVGLMRADATSQSLKSLPDSCW